MPVVIVWCLPELKERKLFKLSRKIMAAVESVPELKLNGKKDVTVLFPKDQMTTGLGEEIIIDIQGLFKKPERTEKVLQRLAETVGTTVAKKFPAAKTECFVYPFDAKKGFWTSQPKPPAKRGRKKTKK